MRISCAALGWIEDVNGEIVEHADVDGESGFRRNSPGIVCVTTAICYAESRRSPVSRAAVCKIGTYYRFPAKATSAARVRFREMRSSQPNSVPMILM